MNQPMMHSPTGCGRPAKKTSKENAAHCSAISATVSPIAVRHYRPDDTEEICSWVRSRSAMRLVSADEAESLTPEILRGWLAGVVCALVVVSAKTDRPLGFCTLTRREVCNLPKGTVELCHLIVAPDAKYFSIGSRLCRAARKKAGELGYHSGFARIVPTNRWALALARRMHGVELPSTTPWLNKEFHWFRLAVEKPVSHTI